MNSFRENFARNLRQISRWFAPGLGVKRWYLLILAGVTLLGVGLSIFLLDLYRTDSSNPILLAILSTASLRFLPRFLRILIFAGLGSGVVIFGIWRLNNALLRPYIRPGHPLVDEIASYRRRQRGPRFFAD